MIDEKQIMKRADELQKEAHVLSDELIAVNPELTKTTTFNVFVYRKLAEMELNLLKLKKRPLRNNNQKDLNEVLEELKEVHKISLLHSANFSCIRPEDQYPTNEKEANLFVKNRINLWISTWIKHPIANILNKYCEDEEYFDCSFGKDYVEEK